jgi:hypothetical protein
MRTLSFALNKSVARLLRRQPVKRVVTTNLLEWQGMAGSAVEFALCMS